MVVRKPVRAYPTYILIISQYYYSRHFFVIKGTGIDSFKDKAQSMIMELESYKRQPGDERPFDFGDVSDEYFQSVKRRMNVNDAGDIYFIPCWSITELMKTFKEYVIDTYDGSRRERRKDVIKSVYERHNFQKIYQIISDYFPLVAAYEYNGG